jgi:hypothetical protein
LLASLELNRDDDDIAFAVDFMFEMTERRGRRTVLYRIGMAPIFQSLSATLFGLTDA